jgi:Flp pilus assembly pilin Flp
MHQYGALAGPESGQTMAEYAITLGVVSLAVVATLGVLTASVTATMSSVIALI